MDMHPYGRGFFDGHAGGPGAIGWTIFALQLLVVLGIAWLIGSLWAGRVGRRAAATPAPLETLHLRYARGEIGRDEYLQAREDLDAS